MATLHGVVSIHCAGTLRVLHLRAIRDGAAVGWRSVGRVCLTCHELHHDDDVALTVEEMIAEGHKVVLRWTIRGTTPHQEL